MATFRSMYNNRPEDVGITCAGSRTKQSFRDECDINTLMRRYERSGVLPNGVGNARYGDFSAVGDFMEAQNLILRSQAQFRALPSRVRDRFRNDAGEFLRFVNDKRNYDEAKALGLLKEEPKAVVDVAPAAPAAG